MCRIHSYWMANKDKDKDHKDVFIGRRNLLWDILRLPSSRRAALGLYIILILAPRPWGQGTNQLPYALLHIGARCGMHCATLICVSLLFSQTGTSLRRANIVWSYYIPINIILPADKTVLLFLITHTDLNLVHFLLYSNNFFLSLFNKTINMSL